MIKIISNDENNIIQTYINYKYFNNNFPENFNIKYTNDNKCLIKKNNNWKEIDIKYLIFISKDLKRIHWKFIIIIIIIIMKLII